MRALLIAISLFSATAAYAEPPRALKIFKAERRMVYEENGQVVRSFKVGLGGAPEGDKVRRGDSKTPEGEFYVVLKNDKSNFHRFIGLSYPMPRHAERALQDGWLDQKTLEAVRFAAKKKRTPPQNTRLGGFVGVHGGGGESDWTLGCIAVTDEEALWLFERLKHGDPIIVSP